MTEGTSTRPVAIDLAEPPIDDPHLQSDGPIAQECPRYIDLMRRALAIKTGAGFGDIEALDAFRLTGPDNEGNPVFIFIPENLPEDDREDAVDRLMLYVLYQVHEVVVRQGKSYTALWLSQNDKPSRLSFRWLRWAYYSIPYVYHERLSSLCIVHPPLQTRLALFALSYLQRHSFWEKLNFADRLEFLDDVVPIDLIKSLPQSYKDADKALDREMYSQDGGALTGMGGMAGMGGFPMPAMPPADGAPGEAPQVPIAKRNWED